MAHVDPLLQVLIKQGGDRLTLNADQAPMFARGVARLKLFLPPFDEATLLTVLGEVSSDLVENITQLNQDPTQDLKLNKNKVTAEYHHALGIFEVSASKSPVLSVRFELRTHTASQPSQSSPASTLISPPALHSISETITSDHSETNSGLHIQNSSSNISALHHQQTHESKVEFKLLPKYVITPNKVTHESLLTLLEIAAERGASDLHLSAHEAPIIRVNGQISPLHWGGRLDVQQALSSLLTEQERLEIEAGKAIDRGVDLNTQLRLRLNIYLHSGGWGAAIRLIRKQPPSLESLNLTLPWRDVLRDPHGLILVCGPTGSGKSTTLAAIAQMILNDRGGILISLEDPIEYQFSSSQRAIVRQRELGLHLSGFAEGLKAALREDPDIILIGEMRDPETIQLALTAAETGHLVLSSLHSRSASSAIERVIDSIPPEGQSQARSQLADSLRGVISQRLIPKRSGEGRVVALEYLRVTHSVATLIRDLKTSHIPTAIQSGGAEGMILLERSLAQLVSRGFITSQAGEAAANDRHTYQQYLDHYLNKS